MGLVQDLRPQNIQSLRGFNAQVDLAPKGFLPEVKGLEEWRRDLLVSLDGKTCLKGFQLAAPMVGPLAG